MTTAGVVLAGGRSSRMGTPKADLVWHGSTLLRRTVGVLSRVTDHVLVVRAAGQVLPPLPPDTGVAEDPREGHGPVQGLAVALAAAAGLGADVAFVCSTDLPFLHPAFVRAVLAAMTDDVDVVLPVALGHRQPLAAAYRTRLAAAAEALVAADRLRPAFLLQQCPVLELGETALRGEPGIAAHDPALDSLVGVNDPGEYARALARPAPTVAVRLGRGAGPVPVRAGTLRAAALAVGLAHLPPAELNGVPVPDGDGALPLVVGDEVTLLLA